MSEYCQIWLTCSSKAEAETIAAALLDDRLAACAKYVPVTSDFWWQGARDHSDEVLLILETKMALYDSIEAQISMLHSYETFVLQAIPIVKISSKAARWLEESITHEH